MRHPNQIPASGIKNVNSASIQIRNKVWVKPPNAHFTTHWVRGVVTDINFENNISVDGVPRLVSDIRRVLEDSEDDANTIRPDEITIENRVHEMQSGTVAPRRRPRE